MFKTATSAAPAALHRGLSRRHLLLTALPLAGAVLVAPRLVRAATGTPVEVWKDPNCGCCYDWIEHMQANGFTVPYNMSEQPAASVNCGYTSGLHPLPIGLQIAGPRFDDLGVLQVARAFEQIRPPQKAWPQPPGI